MSSWLLALLTSSQVPYELLALFIRGRGAIGVHSLRVKGHDYKIVFSRNYLGEVTPFASPARWRHWLLYHHASTRLTIESFFISKTTLIITRLLYLQIHDSLLMLLFPFLGLNLPNPGNHQSIPVFTNRGIKGPQYKKNLHFYLGSCFCLPVAVYNIRWSH